ncbi:helix-turn-helix domain-containing protein [Eubacterium sp.]|uniref:helix-turn-helix domain-containing protein n=1 Tax=Eubacterium sp. TaxID=142586 RepID=UPI0026DF9ADC|nr:helix-turn-helix domain-containing protein [Eubacterium sp.]MDO5433006.1 helix-turn-helix domain-containing protein [Eubacterium sp.]
MNQKMFISAEEMAKELGISKSFAYKLMREMNEELQKKGYLTIAGRVSRKYFEEKFYGMERG